MKLSIKEFLSSAIFIFMALFCLASSIVIFFSLENIIKKGYEIKMNTMGNTISLLSNQDELDLILKTDIEDFGKDILYQKYHKPLSNILKNSDFLYLYIFKLGGEDDIIYVLDAYDTASEDWCGPNDTESLADEDLKEALFHNFRAKGGVTKVVNSQDWGLMRSGTYPIFNKQNKTSSMMTGIDVSLSDIATKTTFTLTKAGIIFILFSIIVIFVSRKFLDSISLKIKNIKNNILKSGTNKIASNLANENMPLQLKNISTEIMNYSKVLDEKNLLNIEIKEKRKNLFLEKILRFKNNKFNFTKNFSTKYKFEIFEHNNIVYFWQLNEKNTSSSLEKKLLNHSIKNLILSSKNIIDLPKTLFNQLLIIKIENSDFETVFSLTNEFSFQKENAPSSYKIINNNNDLLLNITSI